MERHDLNLQKVVVTNDDVKNIEEFFNHFKIEMPDSLKQVIEKFKDTPDSFSFDDQIKLRSFLAHTICSSTHPLLTDKVFDNIRKNCERAWFDAQFDFDVEDVFSEPRG